MTALNMVVRAYLFAGLGLHKIVWEVMKRAHPAANTLVPAQKMATVTLVRVAKIAVLLGLLAQLFVPAILPITSEPKQLEVAGVIIFTCGLAVALLARLALGQNWSDIEVGHVKDDHALVNRGVYRYIRHPIYTGDLAMLIGFEVCLNSWLVVAIAVIAIPTISRAIREEETLAQTVTGYEAYRLQTKRFIPFVI